MDKYYYIYEYNDTYVQSNIYIYMVVECKLNVYISCFRYQGLVLPLHQANYHRKELLSVVIAKMPVDVDSVANGLQILPNFLTS